MKKIIFIFLSACFLSSCGRLDFSMQFFSFYIKSEVDEMFDLSTPQKELFSKNFSDQIEKVKRDQFPTYAAYLEKIVAAYQNHQMNGEKASQLFDEGSVIFLQTPPQWKSAVESVALILKPEQFKSFEEYFNKKIEKQKSKYETKKDQQKQQRKSMERWINETIEDLTSGQEDKLNQYIKINPKPFKLSIESQQFVFQQFKTAFPDMEKRKDFIQKFLTDWKAFQTPEYVKAHDLYLEKLKDYVIDLSLNLHEKQKKHLISNLNHRIKELKKLSEKSAD